MMQQRHLTKAMNEQTNLYHFSNKDLTKKGGNSLKNILLHISITVAGYMIFPFTNMGIISYK